MSRTWICSSLRSGLRFARRNSGRITLLTVATGAAIATATYMRRQLEAVNESLASERVEGARKLRSVFVANAYAVRSAFRALLPGAGKCLANTEQVDSSGYLARLRAKPQDRLEKQELWLKVKVASVTRLASALYLVSVLHIVLSLQMNLLARYTKTSLDAPVQALPAGVLSATTSKHFLDVARTGLLDRRCIDAVVLQIEEVVGVHLQEIGLTAKMGLTEVECLFANILHGIDIGASKNDMESSDAAQSSISSTSPSMLPQWLFVDELSQSEKNSGMQRDANYEWLLQESLDLCEILDFSSVVQSTMRGVLSCVMSWLHADIFEDEDGTEQQRPFVQLFAQFDALVSQIFTVADENSDERILSATNRLEQVLLENEDCARFAASVFLSGEKETERQANEMHHSRLASESQANQRENHDQYVTNISAPSVDPEGDNLGLMFDIK